MGLAASQNQSETNHAHSHKRVLNFRSANSQQPGQKSDATQEGATNTRCRNPCFRLYARHRGSIESIELDSIQSIGFRTGGVLTATTDSFKRPALAVIPRVPRLLFWRTHSLTPRPRTQANKPDDYVSCFRRAEAVVGQAHCVAAACHRARLRSRKALPEEI